jgi:hypothetical protein
MSPDTLARVNRVRDDQLHRSALEWRVDCWRVLDRKGNTLRCSDCARTPSCTHDKTNQDIQTYSHRKINLWRVK